MVSSSAASAGSTSSSSTTTTTNAYISALTRELLGLCLQYTTSDGTLATGGLGIWTYLQYQLALVHSKVEEEDPLPLLIAARDAALEALRTLEGNEEDGALSAWSGGDMNTASNFSSSLSLYSNQQIGCHAILAAIHHQLLHLTIDAPDTVTQQQEYRQQTKYHIQQVLSNLQTTSHHCRNDASVWTGMAGGIQTILFLRQHTENLYLGQDLLLKLAQQLLVQGRAIALDYQRHVATALPPHVSTHAVPTLLWKTSDSHANEQQQQQQQPFEYDLGMPHGLVGILTTLLALTQDEWEAIETVSDYDMHADTFRHARQYVKQTMDVLPQIACHVSSGNLRAQLDNILQDVDRHVSVAYGAPGHILLLLSAHAVFKQPAYLQHAQQLAEEVIWARRIVWSKTSRSGLGLLHGITGNAYVLLQLSQALTGVNQEDSSKLWKSRAEQLARHAVQHWRELLAISSAPSNGGIGLGAGQHFSSMSIIMQAPYSLMGGLGGLVSLLMDLNHQSFQPSVQFPLFYQHPLSVANRIKARNTPNKVVQRSPATTRHPAAATRNSPRAKITVQHNQPSTASVPNPLSLQGSPRRINASSPLSVKVIRRQPSTGNKKPSPSPNHSKTPIASNTSSVIMESPEQEPNKEEGEHTHKTVHTKNSSTRTSASILDDDFHAKPSASIDSNGLESDEAEFILPRPDDVPNQQYLRMQMSFDDERLMSNEQDEEYEGRRQYSNPQLLDEEEHKLARSQEQWSPEEDDADEFQESAGQDAPDERFLRLQDTDNEENTDHFYARDGSAVNPSALDDEGHVTSMGKQKNGLVQGHDVTGISDFASADDDEKPDQRFLQMQDPYHEGDDYYAIDTRLANPALLDEEAHVVSGAIHSSLDLDDFPEFQGPSQEETPDETFLKMQDSGDTMYYVNRGAGQNKGLLDEEDLLRNNRRIIASAREEVDAEEFVESGQSDLPVEDYLRSQDSADEMFFEYDVKENSPLLDEEAHNSPQVSTKKQYSGEWSMSDEEFSEQDYNIVSYRPPVPKSSSEHSTDLGILEDEEDGEDFEIPDMFDEPNTLFLRESVTAYDDAVGQNNVFHSGGGARLDDDGHQSMVMDFLETAEEHDDSDESDEFGETDENEGADTRYLSRQDSANELYFDHYGDQERLLEAKKNVRRLAKQAADKAMKAITTKPESNLASKTIPKTLTTPKTPSKKKGRKTDFKARTPVKGTPASTATSMTAAMSTFSPVVKQELKSRSYLDLAERCFKSTTGQGSLLNGGLGISVYLRIRFSEIEADRSKAETYLKTALGHAQRAVADSKFDDGEKQYLSVISNDFLSSHCLLVSIFVRLGEMEEARNVAIEIIEQIESLYDRDDKHDCSLLFGLSGALQAIWYLRNELKDRSFGRELALTISSTILLEGLEHSGKYRTSSLLMWEWHERPFLGAGTGAVGVLYSMLGHSDEEWDSLNECLPRVLSVVRQCIDCLSEHLLESGNLKAAIDGFEEDKSTDWTHGAPGYCLLLLKAYEVYGDMKYLNQAKHIADDVIWPRRMQRRGLGLSRGVSGVAYVLLSLARVDTENTAVWRSRAFRMAEMAYVDLEELHAMSKNPYSLFEGTGGLVSLLVDLESSSSQTYFPFIEYPPMLIDSNSPRSAKSKGLSANVVENDSSRNEKNPPAQDSKGKFPGSRREKDISDSFPINGRNSHAKAHSRSVAKTETTVEMTTETADLYRTPPRPTDGIAVSPLTEPSPGIHSSSMYPLTEAKIRSRHQHEKMKQRKQADEDNAHDISPQVRPPQVKRHIFTHPLNVAVADHPTESWLAKHQSGTHSVDSMESFDIFSRASVERRLRAEESWLKQNRGEKQNRHVHLAEKGRPRPVSARKAKPESSFRRLVGGFSPPSSSHHATDESVDEKMAHVMEELSERLEDMEMIM